MINLKIDYSVELEVRRVEFTLSKMEWYRTNGYSVSLPEGLHEKSTLDEIFAKVTELYDEEEFKEFATPLEIKWTEYVPKIEHMYSLEGFCYVKDVYLVVLTRYGTGGSYFPEEGKILINCKRERKINPVGTVMHEMTHMGIDHLIQKYNVSHWRKERLVDLLCQKFFSEIAYMQDIPEDVSFVDMIFEQKYPNIELITEAIGGA